MKIRPVTENDCHDLWIWRNHPEVRKRCFENKEIKFDRHKRWFAEKIKDKNVKIYIAENENKEKLGQVRFETKDKKAYINVNLNPLFIGKGQGKKVIKIATELFLKENKNVEEVLAEVIKENFSSQKAFEKGDYIITMGGRKKNHEIVIMTYKRITN